MHFWVFWSRENPSLHSHLNVPGVLTQTLLSSLQTASLFKHSSISMHSWTFSITYPGSQVHLYDPLVFLHLCWHGLFDSHSSISVSHLVPVKPGLHTQLRYKIFGYSIEAHAKQMSELCVNILYFNTLFFYF